MKVAVLSGGVGGARFLRGLIGVVEPGNVSIIGNIADDIEVLGLRVSPDLDSILYTLTGLSDDERGWGRAGRDVAGARSRSRSSAASPGSSSATATSGSIWCGRSCCATGWPLSDATDRIARVLGLEAQLLPATNDPVRTFLETPAGTFAFQTWFVARGHRDEVDAVHYAGAPTAVPAPGVVEAIDGADVILIAPSNPYVSIGPILAVSEIRARARAAAASHASPSAR